MLFFHVYTFTENDYVFNIKRIRATFNVERNAEKWILKLAQ